LLVLSIGAVAVVMETGAFMLYQRHTQRAEAVRAAATLTRSLSANSAAAVSSGNRGGAQAVLGSLAIENQVLAATLFDSSGRLFAEYRRAGDKATIAPHTAEADGERFASGTLTIADGIVVASHRIGSVALLYDLGPTQARLRQHFRVGLGLLLLSIAVRFVVVMRLTRMVTDPLAYLGGVARTISLHHDYTIRAERRTGGEIGLLIDAFNQMLEQIEAHDRGRRAAEESLRESEGRYALAARGSNDGLWDFDATTGMTYLSPRLNAVLGDAEVASSKTIGDWLGGMHPDDRLRVQAEIVRFLESDRSLIEIEYRMRHRDGRYVWMLNRGAAERDANGRPVRVAGSQTDITKNKLTDGVTGLPNRLFFVEQLERALEAVRREPRPLAVLFLDLNHFRTVSDSLGHGASDELLKQVTGRLHSTLRAAGREVVVARTGEDEFAMLLTGLQQNGDAVKFARDTLNRLHEPFYLEGQRLPVGASIGIAFGSPSHQPEELLRNAEAAMYRASTRGTGEMAIFEPSMRERAAARLEVVMGLGAAVRENQLRLRYQPVVSLRERRIIGFESLVRWQHPERGLLQPGEFIAIAEESDLILELGEWVLREACRQMADWQQRLTPDPPLTIGVNVSARQMNDAGFAELVQRVLNETGIDAARLRLEVTESCLATDSGQIMTTLQTLKRMGVSLVIDDFGTGYSSLSYLQRLPFNTLKIDRSFISELGAADGSKEIVRTIIQLARSFKLKVVAEGVETAEQAARLTAMGCDLLQGFYFGKPRSAAQTEALIRRRNGIRPVFSSAAREGDGDRYEAEEPELTRRATHATVGTDLYDLSST
jgi:diguanylate cyclase (GGDEF)-like protein/PAS domain S-box-containing protein